MFAKGNQNITQVEDLVKSSVIALGDLDLLKFKKMMERVLVHSIFTQKPQ